MAFCCMIEKKEGGHVYVGKGYYENHMERIKRDKEKLF